MGSSMQKNGLVKAGLRALIYILVGGNSFLGFSQVDWNEINHRIADSVRWVNFHGRKWKHGDNKTCNVCAETTNQGTAGELSWQSIYTVALGNEKCGNNQEAFWHFDMAAWNICLILLFFSVCMTRWQRPKVGSTGRETEQDLDFRL